MLDEVLCYPWTLLVIKHDRYYSISLSQAKVLPIACVYFVYGFIRFNDLTDLHAIKIVALLLKSDLRNHIRTLANLILYSPIKSIITYH